MIPMAALRRDMDKIAAKNRTTGQECRMLDMLRTLLCGAGALYLAIRIGGLVRAVARGYHTATVRNKAFDGIAHPAESQSAKPEPAIAK